MSVRLPYLLDGKNNQEMSFEESLAINFAQIVKRIKNNEKLLRMTEIFWPVIFIQAEPNFKLMIDKVGVLNLKLKLSNAPRNAQVGHILRNQDFEPIEKLQIAKRIIKFEETIQLDEKENNGIYEDEYIEKSILGLVSPDLLEGFGKIIPKLKEFSINDFFSLESVYDFDNSIDFGQQWIQSLIDIRGYRQRWKSLKEIIDGPVTRWLIDLNVSKKDIQELYRKEIEKANELDEKKIENQLSKEKDNVDVWIVQEQKTLIERIGKMFVGIDLIFEDLRQKNKFFLLTDNLKSKFTVGEVVVKAYQNIAHTRTALEESEKQLEIISRKINDIRKELANTNLSADERIELLNLELKDKQQAQQMKIHQLNRELDSRINEIQEKIDNISKEYDEISEQITNKIKQNKFDEIQLQKWQIDDEITKINYQTLNAYIPIGIGVIEDEDEDERLEIIFPSIYNHNIYERLPLSESFISFEEEISEILDRNMQLRSNFEFTCEKAPNYYSQIKTGLFLLEKKEKIQPEQRKNLVSILETLE